jgi:parallel beta-helix repeat protein
MENQMKTKCLAIGIILLFVATGIIPAIAQNTEKPLTTSRGDWLYVGGSGPGNYSTIQDAINNASSRDTVYVYHATYHEAIVIDVEILSVIGEGRDVTCIDANFSSAAVIISQSCVSLRGFTIIGKNNCVYVTGGLTAITVSENNLSSYYYSVEFAYEGDNNWNVLENNIFNPTSCGIHLASWSDSGFNTIRNNTFINNFHGMEISGNNNIIRNNTFVNCRDCGIGGSPGNSKIEDNIFIGNDKGIDIDGSENKITENIFIGNGNGLEFSGAGYSIIRNHFENNSLGLRASTHNTVMNQNNFIRNENHATFYEGSRSHGNNWDNNYWSDAFYLFGYKCIFGKINTGIKRFIQIDPDNTYYFWIRWINLDKYPAQEPYDIGGK